MPAEAKQHGPLVSSARTHASPKPPLRWLAHIINLK
jgi:hypothetical protein